MYKSELEHKVSDNFMSVKFWYLIPPLSVLLSFSFYVLVVSEGNNLVNQYIYIQKDLFFSLNHILSQYPIIQHNLTQLGDVLILFPLLSIFVVYAPKLWEALLTSALFTLIISATLKRIFAVPRPAAVFDNESFVIIGKTLTGNTSLPSGHSIASFMVMSIILFAFLPKKNVYKVLWFFSLIAGGLIIAFSRVAVGAHYPIDVIAGCLIGFSIAIIGIKTSNKLNWLHLMRTKYHYPILVFILSVWMMLLMRKIYSANLPIFYVSLFSLLITLALITKNHVKKTR